MQQPVNLTLTAEINDKTFPISSFTVNIPVHVNRTYRYEVIDSERAIAKLMPTKHKRTHQTLQKRNQRIPNSIRNRPKRGRGGEIVKPTRWGSTSRVVALPLSDE